MTTTAGPSTADLRELVDRLREGIAAVEPDQWERTAATLTWTRWETAEHIADDLLGYGSALAAPGYGHDIPYETFRRRDGAPDEVVHARRSAGVPGLSAVIESTAALFVAIAESLPTDVLAPHVYGRTASEGFVAMACAEVIVHGWDIFEGTEVTWSPDSTVCSRVLARLFPDVDTPSDVDALSTLLWATGRAPLPDRARRTEWRWYN